MFADIRTEVEYRPDWQDSIFKGCQHILGEAKSLEMEIPGIHFSLSLVTELHPAYTKVWAGNDSFDATIPPYKRGKVKNNEFDVTENESENLKLIQHLRNIYKFLYIDN